MTAPDDGGAARRALTLELSRIAAQLDRAGLGDLAQRIKGQGLTGSKVPRVVLVGETKRGKSALVNALLGAPGLALEDATGTAYAHVAYVHLDDGEPFALVRSADGLVRLGLQEFHALARRPAADGGVQACEVHVREALPGVTIVDTPGVGALDGPRAELARHWAAGGGMVILAVDAGSPLAATELSHLQATAAMVEHVVVALTMIDKYPATWRATAEFVRSQLAGVSGLDRVDVVPVSARWAAAAAALPDGPQRDAVTAAAGVRELQRRIAAVAELGALLPVINGLRLSRQGADLMLGRLNLAAKLASGPAVEAKAQIAELREDLERHIDHAERWTMDLERDFGRLRRALSASITERMSREEMRIKKLTAGLPLLIRPEAAEAFRAEVEAGFAATTEALVAELEAAVDDVVGRLSADDPTAAPSADELRVSSESLALTRDSAGVMGEIKDLNLVMAATSGAMLGLRFGDWKGAAVGAIAYVGLQIAARGQRAQRIDLTTSAREAAARLRGVLGTVISEALDEVRPELIVTYRRRLRARKRELEEAIARAEQLRKEAEQGGAKAAAALAEERTAVAELVARIDAAFARALEHSRPAGAQTVNTP